MNHVPQVKESCEKVLGRVSINLVAVTGDPQDTERDEYTRFIKALGSRIRTMRKERGWTYRDMVVNHGYHLSAWQGYETAKNGISLPSLLRVAKTFGMHPADLIRGVEVGASVPERVAEARENPTQVTRKRIGTAKRH